MYCLVHRLYLFRREIGANTLIAAAQYGRRLTCIKWPIRARVRKGNLRTMTAVARMSVLLVTVLLYAVAAFDEPDCACLGFGDMSPTENGQQSCACIKMT